MFRLNYFLIGLISYFVADSYANAVTFIKPCKADDKECIKSSAQAALPHLVAGIPELGTPVLDPLIIDSMRADEANLKLGFTNSKVTGISKCDIIEVERNMEKSMIEITVECPISAEGQYDLDGKVMVVEAFGKGDYHIYSDKIKLSMQAKVKDIMKDGHKYWKITGFDYTYDLVDKVHFKLTDLFNGDEERAKPLTDIFENNAKELLEGVGGPIVKRIISEIVNGVKTFLLAVPAEELELA